MQKTGRSIGLKSIDTETGETQIAGPVGELKTGPTLTIDQADRAWKWATRNGLIQNWLPELSDDTRELFISGVTPEEWDEMFKDED